MTAPTAQQIKQWIADVVESRREERHLDFKIGASADDLLKDITAMHNTPDSPFGGYGYIVVGVTNTHSVLGLQPEERRKFATADKRENTLIQKLAHHTMPLPSIRVLELTLDSHTDAPLHVIEVQVSSGIWSLIHTDRQENGYFVRRGSQSVPPKPFEVDAYYERLINGPRQVLEREFLILQTTVAEQRQRLEHLTAQRAPAELSNPQLIRQTFQSADTLLLRAVRSEVALYLEKSSAITMDGSSLFFSRLNRPSEAALLSEQDTRPLVIVLEQLENATRPLIELLGVLAHEVQPLLSGGEHASWANFEVAIAELGNAVLFTGPPLHADKLSSPSLNAFEAYPAILLLYGAAVASVSLPAGKRWFVLEWVFKHVRLTTGINGIKANMALTSHWQLRPHLDHLIALTDVTHPICAAVERMRLLMLRPDWLGTVLPATEGKRLTRDAEVITSLMYLSSHLTQGKDPAFVPSAWMMYTNAREQFASTLRLLDGHSQLSIAGNPSDWKAILTLLTTQMHQAELTFKFDAVETEQHTLKD